MAGESRPLKGIHSHEVSWNMEFPDFSEIPSGAWALLLTPVVMVPVIAEGRRRPLVDKDGWTKVSPTVGMVVLGIACLIFAIFFAYGLIKHTLPPPDDRVWVLWIILPPAIAFFVYGVYAVFGIGVRFGPLGIDYRSLWRRRLVPWADVNEVVETVMLGVYLRTNSGRLILLNYRRGFPALLDELRVRGIPGADRVTRF